MLFLSAYILTVCLTLFSDSVATGTASTTMVSSPGQSQSEPHPSPTFSLGPIPSSPVTSPGSFFDETVSKMFLFGCQDFRQFCFLLFYSEINVRIMKFRPSLKIVCLLYP